MEGIREQVGRLLAEGKSLAEIGRLLGISKSTACYHKQRLGLPMRPEYARRYDWVAVQQHYDMGLSRAECIERFGFSPWAWAYAVKRGAIVPRPQSMPLGQLLQLNRPRGRHHIKLRLLAAGLKENRCEECGIDKWRGKPLSVALHHVNGNKHDNRLENLALLCPNCHSQTPNFSAKNIRGGQA